MAGTPWIGTGTDEFVSVDERTGYNMIGWAVGRRSPLDARTGGGAARGTGTGE